jgi:hypothetical protein
MGDEGWRRGWERVATMDWSQLDIRQFIVFAGGDVGVSFDVASGTIILEGVADDDRRVVGTTFQLIAICPHCEQIHRPILRWNGRDDLAVLDAGGLDFLGAEGEAE